MQDQIAPLPSPKKSYFKSNLQINTEFTDVTEKPVAFLPVPSGS